ncbi:MAG: trigger factor [Streptobacillus sp.]
MKKEILNGSEVAFEIVKDGEEFAKLRKEVLAKFKNVKVDGFRKGHVPEDVIEKTFADDIRDEILNRVIREEYAEVLKDKSFKPVSELQITDLKLEKDSLKVNLKVAVFPEFDLPEYKGLNVELEKAEVSDEDVSAQLDRMLSRAKKYEKTTREEAKNGDIANIDFEGFIDGVAFEGGKAQGHKLELGSKTFIDNFEEQIVGHKVGEEFEVNVKFPEEYHAENLKGKPAVFKVKLNSLEEIVLPELNDTFAKENGADTLEDLKTNVRANLLVEKENQAKNVKLSKIVEKIVDGVNIEVPEILVEQDIDANIAQFVQQLQMQGMNLESYLSMTGQTVEKMREDLRANAIKGIKTSFVLSKVGETEDIKVSDEDIENELKNIASMYGMDVETIKSELEKSGELGRYIGRINSQLFFGKINEFLLENN